MRQTLACERRRSASLPRLSSGGYSALEPPFARGSGASWAILSGPGLSMPERVLGYAWGLVRRWDSAVPFLEVFVHFDTTITGCEVWIHASGEIGVGKWRTAQSRSWFG